LNAQGLSRRVQGLLYFYLLVVVLVLVVVVVVVVAVIVVLVIVEAVSNYSSFLLMCNIQQKHIVERKKEMTLSNEINVKRQC